MKFTKGYKGMNLKFITTTVGLNIGEINISGIKLSFWDLGKILCNFMNLKQDNWTYPMEN
jgi:hypothetical protein